MCFVGCEAVAPLGGGVLAEPGLCSRPVSVVAQDRSCTRLRSGTSDAGFCTPAQPRYVECTLKVEGY